MIKSYEEKYNKESKVLIGTSVSFLGIRSLLEELMFG